MSDQKNIAQLTAELAQHVLEVELRMGVDQVLLTYLIADLAAKGMLSSNLLQSARNMPAPAHLRADDEALFAQLLQERVDMLASVASKLTVEKV